MTNHASRSFWWPPCESNTAPTDYEYRLVAAIATVKDRSVTDFSLLMALPSENRPYAEP